MERKHLHLHFFVPVKVFFFNFTDANKKQQLRTDVSHLTSMSYTVDELIDGT